MGDPGLEVLGRLLEASHELAPDALVAAVTRTGRALDAEDVAIYLVDHEQTLLVPLPDGTDRAPLEIDTTLAGRAFAAVAVQEAETGSGQRLWLPLLDGAERLGVLGLTLPRVNDPLRKRCRWLASLTAELLVSKTRYTRLLLRRPPPPADGPARRAAVAAAPALDPRDPASGDRRAPGAGLRGRRGRLRLRPQRRHRPPGRHRPGRPRPHRKCPAAVTVGSYRHSRRAGLDLKATHAAMDQAIAGQFGGERFVTASSPNSTA